MCRDLPLLDWLGFNEAGAINPGKPMVPGQDFGELLWLQ